MKKLFITIISALLCLPLAAVEREDEAFPLDTADVVWTFTEGNRVKLLNNADAKFIDLLTCIDTARHSVHLEYFNFRNDSINKIMMTLLARKLKEGVEVRILFDDFGNISNDRPIRRKHLREMRELGFKIKPYDPMQFPWINHAFHRDHRKVAVVDGQTAFIGGINVADYYVTGLPGVGDWRDMHLRIEGPAANIVQRNFITMWNAETKEKLSPSDYCLAHTAYADGVPVAIVNDHPRHSNGDILDAYLWLIGEAKREIKIVTPYFLPPPSIRRALTHAVERGVDVQILISAKGDIALTPEGSKRMGYKLTKRGVNVFLFNGGFHHSKVMSIDDDCCMIGSANLESRSLFYDHEQNAIVVDTALVDDFVEIYEADKLNNDTLTHELYKSATPWKRFVGRLAVFLRPIL